MPVRLTPRPAPLEMLTIRPAALPLHARRHGLRAEEGAGEVDVEDGLPVGLADLLERPADLAAHAAGIVDQDVDRARGGDLATTACDRCAVADVQRCGHGSVPGAAPASRRARRRRRRRPRRWRRASAKAMRDRAAEAVRGAGDDDRRGRRSSMFMRRAPPPGAASSSSSPAERPPPARVSWISSTSRASRRRTRDRARARDRHDRDELGVDLGPRLRTARSRQMPLCDLAERRLKATMSSKDRSIAAADAPGAKACGSKPLKASSLTPSAAATRADLARRARRASGESDCSASTSAMRVVGERGGEQQRAVDQLAPEIAPDVARSASAFGSKSRNSAMQLLDPRRCRCRRARRRRRRRARHT